MRIHLDTNLLIQRPRFEALPEGEHTFAVSALAMAKLTEGLFSASPEVAGRAGIDLIDIRSVFGDGVPFGAREAEVYREVCAAVVGAGRSVTRARRMDMMIAAVAVSDGAALATRNTSDFGGLESVLTVLEL